MIILRKRNFFSAILFLTIFSLFIFKGQQLCAMQLNIKEEELKQVELILNIKLNEFERHFTNINVNSLITNLEALNLDFSLKIICKTFLVIALNCVIEEKFKETVKNFSVFCKENKVFCKFLLPQEKIFLLNYLDPNNEELKPLYKFIGYLENGKLEKAKKFIEDLYN